jgi:hypothetical protein
LSGVGDGVFWKGAWRVRDGVGGGEGLFGISGGRVVLYRNNIRNLLIGIGGTIYTGLMNVTVVLMVNLLFFSNYDLN